MALVVADRVQETTNTTGTGTLTLAGASSGFQSFTAIGNGNTTYYAIVSGTDWEVGLGTYTSAGTTLSRDTVLASSAGGVTKISVTAGATVFATYPAGKAIYTDASGNVIALGTVSSGTWQGTAVGLAYGGTGKASAPAANANLMGFTSTATAGATTTLTNTSSYYQVFTGTLNQTVQLPATSTLAAGWSFHIVNNSTGTLTVQTATAVSLGTVPAGVTAMPTALNTTGDTATDWEFGYTDFSTLTGTGNNVLATSPTLTTPTLGVATATSINKMAITAPATSSTLAVADGKTLTASSTLTLAGTDATTMTFPTTSQSIAGLGVAQTWTAAQTFRAASAIRSEAASTQDAIVIAGRAGGSNSYALSLTPDTLVASRTVTLPDGGGNYTVGYRNLPAVGTQSGAYTVGVADVGKYVQVSTGGSIVVPSATFAEGDIITIFNNTTGAITLTLNITTAYLAGVDADKNSLSLATRGVATILFISSTVCVVSGNVS